MNSIKISCRRTLIIMWAVLLAAAIVVALLMTIPTFLEYGNYLKGQEIAVSITLEATNVFDDPKYQNDRQALVNAIYRYYCPTRQTFTVYGATYDNKDVVEAARKADETFGELMRLRGFECFYGSEYLRYTSLQEYAGDNIKGEIVYVSIVGSLIVIMMLINVLYVMESQKEIVISESPLYGKNHPRRKPVS